MRLNKAIAMQGIQVAGMHAGLLLEGALAALVHSSHNEERQRLLDIQAQQGTKAYLEARDAPFQPEPMGPRSARGREKRNAVKKKLHKTTRSGVMIQRLHAGFMTAGHLASITANR